MASVSPIDLADQSRDAFATASAHSIADAISPDLLSGLVQEGLLSSSDAFTYAIEAGDQDARLVALSPLLEEPALLQASEMVSRSVNVLVGLPPLLARLAQRGEPEHALALAEVQPDKVRAWSLLALLPVLPQALRERAVAGVRDAAGRMEDQRVNGRAHVLLALAPHVRGPERAIVIDDAREAAAKLKPERKLIRAFRDAGAIDDALSMARSGSTPYDQAAGLTEVIPAVSPRERDGLVEEWLAIASAEEHGLPRLPVPLPSWAIPRVLHLVLGRPEPERARLLVRFALRHPDAVLSDALAALDALPRFTALIGRVQLAPVLDEATRRSLEQAATAWVDYFLQTPDVNALEHALDQWGFSSWDESLTVLRPILPEDRRRDLLRWQLTDARLIRDGSARAQALVRFAVLLDGPARAEILDLARRAAMSPGWHHEGALQSIAEATAQPTQSLESGSAPAQLAPNADPIERLAAAAPDQAPEERRETLRQAMKLARSARWAWPLFSLIPCASDLEPEDALFLWTRMLSQLSGLARFSFFKGDYDHDFGHLAPLVLRLGGPAAIVAVARTIGELEDGSEK